MQKQSKILGCENCGCPEELFVYEHVLEGIRLCSSCADLPIKEVSKKEHPQWRIVGGAFVHPNCISCKQSEMPKKIPKK